MNVFELFAKIDVDTSGYESALDKAANLGKKVASGIGTAMKVGAAAVGAASTAVGALVTQSVKAYADYEQMVGGVQKLYGNMGMGLEEYAAAQGKSVDEVKGQWENLEKAQNMVLENAQNAYRTAGMSANKYMEIATSFSASLINSLDGDSVAAAEATDKAMTAIADNWNTFGGDIGMIQGAFQGFAKGNYTMLDNLKLGYGGTKTEMEKLIADANEYAATIGQASDLSIESFADIVTAIDLIQQKQNIAGTTAREASTTISGSLGMVKASWENLVTGMSDKGADLSKLMDNLVNSITGYTEESVQVVDGYAYKQTTHVKGLIDNILPVVEKAIDSVGTLIDKLAPKLGEEIPKLIQKVFPKLLSAGAGIISSLVQGITDALPQLLFTAGDMIEKLLTGLLEATSSSESTIMEIINTILSVFEENYMQFIDVGLQILQNIFEGLINSLPDALYYAQEIILHLADAIIDNLPLLIETAFQLILTLAEGIAQALPELIPKAIEAIITFVTSLIDNIDLLIDAAIALITGLAEGIINALPILIERAPEIIIKLVEAIIANTPKILEAGIQLIVMLVTGIMQAVPKVYEAIVELFVMLFTTIKNKFPEMLQSGKDIINKFKDGIATMKAAVKQAMVDVLTGIRDKVKEWFGQAKTWGADMISNFVDGIKSKIGDAINAAKELGQSIKDYLGFSEPKYGPLSNFHTYAPDMVDLFAKGIYESKNVITKAISDTFDIGSYMTAPSFTTPAFAGAYGTSEAAFGGYNQTIIINSPTALTPSEIARQTRNATRDMVLELRGK